MKPNYRSCVSCRKVGPKETFWRIVRVYPSHQIQLETGSGRSAYLCPQADCLKIAQKKKRFNSALRVPVSPDIYDRLWQRLTPESRTGLPLST